MRIPRFAIMFSCFVCMHALSWDFRSEGVLWMPGLQRGRSDCWLYALWKGVADETRRQRQDS